MVLKEELRVIVPNAVKKKKPNGRWWKCRNCGFESHRDVVGALNMFPLAFDEKIAAPKDITYLRIPSGKSSSSLGTGQSCLNDCTGVSQPLAGACEGRRVISLYQFRSSSSLGD